MWPPCPSLFTLIVADDGSPWWWTISRQLLRCPQSRMGDRWVKWWTRVVGCLLGKRGFVLDLWHLLSCDPHNPHLASTHHSYPHQLPVTPHHSPASACHVLGVKGFPPIAHQKGTPPSRAPCTKSQSIAWQTEMDWDIRDPVPFREAPALHGAAVMD